MHLQVRGEVHHDRRLHQLMLQEGEKAWNSSRSLPSKPRSARVDITGRASVSSVALGSPSDSAGSMHAADCSPLDLGDPLALYRWALLVFNGILSSVICAGSAHRGLAGSWVALDMTCPSVVCSWAWWFEFHLAVLGCTSVSSVQAAVGCWQWDMVIHVILSTKPLPLR